MVGLFVIKAVHKGEGKNSISWFKSPPPFSITGRSKEGLIMCFPAVIFPVLILFHVVCRFNARTVGRLLFISVCVCFSLPFSFMNLRQDIESGCIIS